MAKLLKLRRGSTSQHSSFTGAEGEVTVDTDKDSLVVHDGSTAGGHPVAAEDMANVSSASIVGRIGTSALAGTKVSPDFGSQTITTTGSINTGNHSITDTHPRLFLNDSNTESDFSVDNHNGNFKIVDIDNSDRMGFMFGSDGNTHLGGNTTFNGDLIIPDVIRHYGDSNTQIRFPTTNAVSIQANGTERLRVSDHVDITGNLDVSSGVDVTGNITVSGTVDGVDIATRDAVFGALTSGSATLTNGVLATTQAQSDNTTKVATTAYVRTAISEAQAFPSGTKMLFQQTSAPTGWTKVTSGVDNKALRVVSGTAGSGGSNAFTNTLASRGITANAGNTTAGGNVSVSIGNSTVSGNISVANATQGGNVSVSVANASAGGTVNSHTLSTSEMPSHSHTFNDHNIDSNRGMTATNNAYTFNNSFNGSRSTNNTGGGGAHNHGFTGSSHSHNANATFSGSAHNHNATFSGGSHDHNANATFSGSAHNHSISVTNLDMAVQYLDVIIASKD